MSTEGAMRNIHAGSISHIVLIVAVLPDKAVDLSVRPLIDVHLYGRNKQLSSIIIHDF
jgi:hypothetical protein